MPIRVASVDSLEYRGDTLAAANAHGHQTISAATTLQLV
jgi:hypothetical protein